MAVLNKIRQRSIFLIIVIAMALFAFVVGDVLNNLGSSSESESVIAIINGEEIERSYFMNKVENIQRRSSGQLTNTQAMNRVWDNEVRSKVFKYQYDLLGISVERDYMRNLLEKNLASYDEFMNEAGLFDEYKLNEFISNLKAISPETTTLGGTPVNYEAWTDFEQNVAIIGIQQTYFNMVRAGITGTLTEGEMEYQLENDKVNLKYIQIPYSSISDSTINVKPSEIKSYMKRFPSKFKVDASRDLVFIEFKEEASLNDEDSIKEYLESLIDDREEFNVAAESNENITGFKNTTDNKSFVNSYSDDKFYDNYLFRSSFSSKNVENITSLSVNGIYGPYKDGTSYKLTKMLSTKSIPDSVKVRHILIPFIGSLRADESVTSSSEEAKFTADSIYSVLKKSPSKFKSLLSFSSDKVSNEKDGIIEFAYNDPYAPEFKSFSFENPKGSIGVVLTDFGYHVIEVMNQGNKQKAFKVATITKSIEPSEETRNEVFKNKSNFEIALATSDFQSLADEKKYSVRNVNSVKELDENIPGLGSQRSIVRWAFDNDTDEGDFKSFTTKDGFVIVKLVNSNSAGFMSVESGSVTAIPEIRKEKKAEIIKNRINSKDINDIADNENQAIKSAVALNMKNPTLSGAGLEPLVIGTAFGLGEGNISEPISGNKGVYIVQVTKITPATELNSYQATANRVGKAKENAVNSQLFNALKEAAEIEDNRAIFY